MRNPALALASLLMMACNAGPYCDRDAAEAALAAAAVGETVELGSCEIQGPLHVPPGVQLAGTTGTVVVAPVESGGIVALGGDVPSTIHDLTVRVEGRVGILVRGGGAARIADVTIDARRGIAFGASELAELELARVTLTGPVHADNAMDSRWVRVAGAPAEPAECPDPSGCDCTPGELDEAGERACDAEGRWATWTATFGLVLSDIGHARLIDVDVNGFAAWGALLTDSDVVWGGGGVADTLGVGVRQVGGTLALSYMAAVRTHGGLRGDRPYAIQATDGARVEGLALSLVDNERYGLLLSGSTGRLENLVATGNGDAALWISESTDFELTGAGSALADNGFAGAVVVRSSGVRLAEATIQRTVSQERPIGAIGVLRIGDGVHVIETAGAVELADLVLTDNERAGVLVDLGAAGAGDVTFSSVSVTGTGAQLGAIAGRPGGAGQLTPEAPGTWDAGITRGGAVSANDLAFTGSIAAVTEPLPGPTFDPGNVLAVVAPMF
ncbi:MAG: hypothetical protein H6719_29315 [Sandaracinaceae bacterium]|nr:hypothetical protein [Sandaracinaceae bacterium]